MPFMMIVKDDRQGRQVGAFVWGGLLLRDNRLRTLIPWRRKPAVV